MPILRYPRVGFPIVPRLLRELFERDGLMEFARLDADAWHRLGEGECRRLARRLAPFLDQHREFLTQIGDEPALALGEAFFLDDLQLGRGTYRALRRAGPRTFYFCQPSLVLWQRQLARAGPIGALARHSQRWSQPAGAARPLAWRPFACRTLKSS